MIKVFKRLKGHIEWHLRQLRRNIAASRPHPEILSLQLRNRFWRARIVANRGPVVSLTSYGNRLQTVFLTIESIARGNVKPGRLILWLDEEPALSNPPRTLKRLIKRGLEIRRTENYLSHKKYLPYVLSCDTFAEPLVTADDDVIYPRDWLQSLINAYSKNSTVINCFRARVINVQDGNLQPFTTWQFCTSTAPSFKHFSEGVGGVIFPPQYLSALKQAGTAFSETCPRHDDVWLNVTAVRNGFPVRQIRTSHASFNLIPDTQKDGLWVANLGNDGDTQIRATYSDADVALIERDCTSTELVEYSQKCNGCIA